MSQQNSPLAVVVAAGFYFVNIELNDPNGPEKLAVLTWWPFKGKRALRRVLQLSIHRNYL